MALDALQFRPVVREDHTLLAEWIADPLVEPAFPMGEPHEIEEGAKRWVEMGVDQGSGLVAVYKGVPVGMGLLFLQTYTLIRHNCVHVLVVSPPYRELGIGEGLLGALEGLARDKGVSLLHVEVYGDPAAVHFYLAHGYTEFGRQQGWTKTPAGYGERVLLEKFL
ncbi:MAG: N-acetyltransferase family protein [Parachlamydiales bacterium]